MNTERRNPFEALLEITNEINYLHEIDELLVKVLDIAMETLEAERGFVLLRDLKNDDDFEVVTARQIDEDAISDIRNLSSSAVNLVLGKGESVLTYDALQDKRFAG